MVVDVCLAVATANLRAYFVLEYPGMSPALPLAVAPFTAAARRPPFGGRCCLRGGS
ncbi:MAG: hypothetical protein ACRDHS_15080 [Actinomycetota bacterium]